VFKERLGVIKKAGRELAKADYLLKVCKHGPQGKLIWGWAVFEVPLTPQQKDEQITALARQGWKMPSKAIYRPKGIKPVSPSYDRLHRPAFYSWAAAKTALGGEKASGCFTTDG
jgi:hypothetical protein